MNKDRARIDVKVEDKRFNLSCVKAGGGLSEVQLFKADWLLSIDQERHWIVKGFVDSDWRQMYIEFISGGTGNLMLEFRGDFFDDLKVNHHEIWIDSVEFSGGEIVNGSFEGLDEHNHLIGWNGSSIFNDQQIVPKTGNRCVLIWHHEPVMQRVSVRAGKRYKVSGWFRSNVV